MSDLLTFLTTHEEPFRKGRLGALYSDFRHLRATNPDGYAANISAWRKALTEATRAGRIPSRGDAPDILILSVAEPLLRALETKECGRPLALGAVINDMLRQKDLVPMREFLEARQSIYQRPRVASQLFHWSLRQLGLAADDADEEATLASRGPFVVVANVEDATARVSHVLAAPRTRADKIYAKDLFCQELADALATTSLSAADASVLLRYLAREKRLIAYDAQTVKILTPGSAEPAGITSEDAALASLKALMASLRMRNASLELRIAAFAARAREAVAGGNRIAARAALRSKRLAETTLEGRAATLAQLEEVFASVERAADQVEFVHVMEVSTGVLRGLSAEVGGVERVDRVVEGLRCEMEQVDEVGEVLGESGRVDEGEVADELEGMEREEREKVARREREERDAREKVARREKEEREGREEKEKAEREDMEAEETRRRLDALPGLADDQKGTERPALRTT